MNKPRSTISVILLAAMAACFILLSYVQAARPQPLTPECPVIYIGKCPDSCVDVQKPCSFTAELSNAKPNQKLTYNWSVSKGKIIEGQGTPSITVDLSGTDRKAVTATVEVIGLDEKCPNKASCATSAH